MTNEISETKQKIIDCTLSIIGTEGVRQLTTAKIIKCAGISKGSLYHHFKSIDEILFESIGILIDEILGELDLLNYSSGRELWEHLGKVLFKQMQERRELYLAYFSTLDILYRDKKLMENMYIKYADFVSSWLKALELYYGLTPENPKTMNIFTMIDSSMSGFTMMGLADTEGKMYFPAWNTYIEMLDNYLLTEGKK